MKKLAILTTSTDNPSSEIIRSLCISRDLEWDIISLKDLIENDSIRNYDYVLNRCTGLDYKDQDLDLLKKVKGRVSPQIKTTTFLRGKWEQFKFYRDHSIPCIPTLNYTDVPSKAKFYQVIEKLNAQDSWVIKMNRSMNGIGCIQIDGIDRLFSLYETFYYMGDTRFVIQPYRKMPEFRSYMSGKKSILLLEKQGSEFKKNLRFSEAWLANDKYPNNFEEKISPLTSLFEENDFWCIDFFQSEDSFEIIETNLSVGLKSLQFYPEVLERILPTF